MLKLSGTAFITGAGSGIGKATALAFARYEVRQFALLDLKRDAIEHTYRELKLENVEAQAAILPADTANESTIQNAIRQTAEQFKSISYGVNCAVIGGPHTPIHNSNLQNWQKVLDVNQTGVWICQKQLIQQMPKQEYEPKLQMFKTARSILLTARKRTWDA